LNWKLSPGKKKNSKDPSLPFKEKEKENEGRSKAWWPKEGEGEGEGSPTWWPMEGSKLGGQWGGARKKSFSLLLTFPPTNFI
jgi:hypothetical protein